MISSHCVSLHGQVTWAFLAKTDALYHYSILAEFDSAQYHYVIVGYAYPGPVELEGETRAPPPLHKYPLI